MSNRSNDQGRAYEFISLLILGKEISEIRPATIIKNSIFDLEPRIIEDGNDEIELFIQTDQHGEQGDVRDILIVRRKIAWEIGLSLKHNHFAVKHSRLSKTIDFGQIWYDIPCSDEYWSNVIPVFEYLTREKAKGTKFSELPSKENDVYVPILKAFISEINKQYETNTE